MNNTSRYLIYASLVSLAFAVLGGLWLVWHTIEEGRSLERQNRELQASLEASRIRVENFCEYPSDVLCRVDERSGTVAGALPGNLPGLDELVGTPAPKEEKVALPAPADVAPSKALENIQKVAQAQAEVEAKASKPASIVEEKPAPLPEPEKAKEEKGEEPLALPQKEEPVAPAAPAPVVSVAEEAKPAPEVIPVTKVEPVIEAPAPRKEELKESEAKAEEAKENTPVPSAPIIPAESSPAPSYTQEFSGKLSDMLPEKPATAEPEPKKADSPAKKQAANITTTKQALEKRMSWSRVEQDGDIFVFTITGAGETLNAHGKLLPSPWRYELELDGIFDVRHHKGISNRLVKSMKVTTKNSKTVIMFSLKAKPYKSSLHQIDARTLSVRIR